ncbi:MAG: hypothetical protein PHY45_07330 [Rhodocyclaceae bacterium]|nr:hypothetical protein [Rhodocyclaceae bacterium]
MIVRRRTWLYRLAGQKSVQTVSFAKPVTTARARDLIRRTVGIPVELWGRSALDVAPIQQ